MKFWWRWKIQRRYKFLFTLYSGNSCYPVFQDLRATNPDDVFFCRMFYGCRGWEEMLESKLPLSPGHLELDVLQDIEKELLRRRNT